MSTWLQDYRVVTPQSLTDALAYLASHGRPAGILAGGTDLMVALAAGRLPRGTILNVAGLDELKGIVWAEDHVRIGALVSYDEILSDKDLGREFGMLHDAARQTGAAAIAHRGTLGGNIANASPAADSPPALLAYDAQLELQSTRGARILAYDTFHTGYRTTAAAADELIAAILLPRGPGNFVDRYRKVGARGAQAIAKIGLAARFEVDGARLRWARIALSSVAPVPFFARKSAQILSGSAIDDSATIAAAVAMLQQEIQPIDDIRSTAGYRRAVAGRLLRDALASLRPP